MRSSNKSKNRRLITMTLILMVAIIIAVAFGISVNNRIGTNNEDESYQIFETKPTAAPNSNLPRNY